MSNAMIGRLILEASTGMHGEESKILADVWADMAQQRAELLEALKDMRSGWRYIRETHGDLYGVGWDRAEDKANAAITKAEAAE